VIKKPTVLVLGAGASAPYAFPLGSELLDGIQSELLREPFAFRDDLRSGEINDVMLKQFGHALRNSGLYAIDEYLQWHPAYRDLGKLAIARTLIPAEREDRLDFAADYKLWSPPGSPDMRWYRICSTSC
jgi:hypothetical protein